MGEMIEGDVEPIGWAYRDKGSDYWVLCPSDTKPRPFEDREIEPVYRASQFALSPLPSR